MSFRSAGQKLLLVGEDMWDAYNESDTYTSLEEALPALKANPKAKLFYVHLKFEAYDMKESPDYPPKD